MCALVHPTCTCAFMYTSTYKHRHIHLHIYSYIYIYAYRHTLIHTHIRLHIHITNMHTNIYVYNFSYVHTHISKYPIHVCLHLPEALGTNVEFFIISAPNARLISSPGPPRPTIEGLPVAGRADSLCDSAWRGRGLSK